MNQGFGFESYRTDLALEAMDRANRMFGAGRGVPGVESETEREDGIVVTRIRIRSEEGAQALGKPPGRYVTIEAPGLRRENRQLEDRVADRIAREFAAFFTEMGLPERAGVLVVGLGNRSVTPDALGPFVVEGVTVTRHLDAAVTAGDGRSIRPISAVAPGVLGTTGIETSEIVQGIVEKVRPVLVVAVDALASQSLERVCTTIQMADSGIHPGSGIGNKRKGLTRDTLGVPVLAVGVPTVVYASTIVNNTLEMLIRHVGRLAPSVQAAFGALGSMSGPERLSLVREVLEPLGQDLLVTPKDIDRFVADAARLIADGLNAALFGEKQPEKTV